MKKFLRILLVVVLFYFTCYSFHSCSMMVEGSKLKDEDIECLIGREYVDSKEELVLKFQNDELILLRQFDKNDELISLDMYLYEYDDGTLFLEHYRSVISSDNAEEDEEEHPVLSIVMMDINTMYFTKFKRYIFGV